MALDYTSQKIKELIKHSKLAEPYTEEDDEYDCLDAELDGARMIATYAQNLLDAYFRQHPEDKIENYID